jgi:hypothetical protein
VVLPGDGIYSRVDIHKREVKRMKKAAVALSAILLVGVPAFAQTPIPSICDAVTGNLVANCGFETGDFTNWNVANGFTMISGNGNLSLVGPTGNANSGDYFAALGAFGSNGDISQTITDAPGQTYTFSFYYGTDGWTPDFFSASWDGVALLSQTNDFGDPGHSTPWTQYSFQVVGTGTDTIDFAERNDPQYDGLDDVVVVASTPEPSSMILLGSLLVGAGMIRKRKK